MNNKKDHIKEKNQIIIKIIVLKDLLGIKKFNNSNNNSINNINNNRIPI